MSAPFSGTHFGWTRPELVWTQLLRPWFAACSRIGWDTARAPRMEPVLLAPDPGLIAWVKGRVVAEGIGCLGVQFHSVGTLRGLLSRAYAVEARLALREDLHLIMGQAARSLPDNPVAQAAVLDPAGLTRLCDRIDRGDWREQGLATAAGRELATRYFELLDRYGLRTAASVEREVLQKAWAVPLPACGYLLAIGFGAEHAESLPLLRAAVLSAQQAIVCLDSRGGEGSGSASASMLAWQASCEEYFGPALPLAEDGDEPEGAAALPADSAGSAAPDVVGSGTPAPAVLAQAGQPESPRAALRHWCSALASHRSVDANWHAPLQRGLRLQTFRTLRQEAQSVVRQVRHWLGESAAVPSLRIGIVLPEGGSLLGREIAAGLSALGIAHYDSLGHQPARTASQQLLENWCAWQSSNQLDDFTAFLRELARQGGLPADTLRRCEHLVEKAFTQTLCAELSIIRAFLGDSAVPAAGVGDSAVPAAGAGGNAAPAASESALAASAQQSVAPASGDASSLAETPAWKELFEQWPQLPAEATFAEFWQHTRPVLEALQWPPRAEALLERATGFGQVLGEQLPRTAFIAWLRSVTRVPGRTRSAEGHEPFAVVQLVNLAEASRQHWSHLCLVGMVHALWPPLQPDSALLDSARCTWLNTSAEQPSRFGLGQTFIGGTHTFMAAARERREWFEAAFLRLIKEGGAGAIALSRYRFEPSSGSAEVFASEYFLRAVYAATGSLEIGGEEPASQPDTAVLLAETGLDRADAVARWQDSVSGGVYEKWLAAPQVALAYCRRRDPASGFDAYSYGLLRPPVQPLRLSCSHWAEALSRPANAWYRYVLRVKKRLRASQTDVRRQSRGTWIHRWVNPSAEAADNGFPRSRGAAEHALLQGFIARPERAYWRDLILRRALVQRRNVKAAYELAGRMLPQWWESDWGAALAIANGFADTLGLAGTAGDPGSDPGNSAGAAAGSAPATGYGSASAAGAVTASAAGNDADALAGTSLGEALFAGPDTFGGFADEEGGAGAGWLSAAGEWKLPPQRFDRPGHPLDGLLLEGVVDLLLSPLSAAELATAGGQADLCAHPALWLVDFKTGGDDTLSLSTWESRGAGLQLVLYAYALSQLGARQVQMTILKPGAPLVSQLSLDELLDEAPVWEQLAPLMRQGIFGSRGSLRGRHSFSGDYPIATLGVDPVILERKAAHTLAAANAL